MARPAARPRLSAAQRRAAIVRAAIRLFAEKGFEGTTTRELAAAAGVTEPVLYQHFATKRDLYTAIIESTCEVEQKSSDAELEAARHAGDDRKFFTRLAELVLDWHRRHADVVRLLLFSGLGHHELADLFFQRQVAVYYDMLTGYIKERARAGAFRRIDPYLAARGFTGMVAHQGLAMVIFGDRTLEKAQQKLVRTVVAIFLNGIAQERPKSK